jgi:hypothetical protein
VALMGQKMSSRSDPCSHTLLFFNTSMNNGCPCLRLQEYGRREASVGFRSLHATTCDRLAYDFFRPAFAVHFGRVEERHTKV